MGQAEEEAPSPAQGKTGKEIIAHIGQGLLPEMLAKAELATTLRQRRASWRRAMSVIIFSFYAARTGQKRAILTEARERMICLRLEEGFDDIHTMLYAVDGLAADDFVMGRDPRSKKVHASPELLFRTWGQVEQYALQRKGYNENEPHPLVTKHGIPEIPKEGA